MTVEEFLEKSNCAYDENTVKYLLKEFAKLKVKEALEIVAKNALIDMKPLKGNYYTEAETSSSFEADLGYEDCYNMVEYSINKESIINSYPLDNIK
jgi:hypothetical protein